MVVGPDGYYILSGNPASISTWQNKWHYIGGSWDALLDDANIPTP